MILDRPKQIRRSSVVEEEDPLTNSPEWRGSEFVWARLALDDFVCQLRAHVMNEQIRVQIDRSILQNRAVHDRGGLHLGGVAQGASDIRKDRFAPLGTLTWTRIRCGAVREPHHDLKVHPVRQDVQRIVKPLVPSVVRVGARNVVRCGLAWPLAGRVTSVGVGKTSFVIPTSTL